MHKQLMIISFLLVMPFFTQAQEKFSLNLKDADISTLIQRVSELTKKNFIVDPRVKASKVTVISSSPLNKDEIYNIFLSILEVHGYSTIPVGNVIKIVPVSKARQGSIPLINGFSKVGGDQMVSRVIRVKNVSAAQLVPILRPLIPPQGHMAAYPSTNVLVISDRADNVERLYKIITRIDRVSDSDIDIIQLRNASAAEMLRILTGLQSKAQGTGGSTPVQFAADERTNSILLSGEASARLRYRVIISHLDTPLESGGNTKVIYLKYAKAKDLVPVLTGVSKTIQGETKKGTTTASANDINIQADESSNALVITAAPDILRSLESVIRQLDIRRAQVLVEAIIAEVTVDKSRELGVQWIIDGSPGGRGAVGVINFGGASGIANIAATIQAGLQPQVGDGVNIGVGKFNSGSVNFAAILRALGSDADSNILSTPSIVTLDNQKAEIIVGQNVPFVTGEFSSAGGTTSSVNPFRTIQRQDVGITLRVTPQINEGDAIKLEIEQEVSNVIPSSAGASDLTTSKRSIKTTVMVDDGKTIVLGGLIDDGLQQTNQKVPILGDIPLFGRLFRYDKTTKTKRNLMIFLRPVILRDAALQSRITEGKYSYIRARQLDVRNRGVRLMDDSHSPVLPKSLSTLPVPFDPPKNNNSGSGSSSNSGE